MFVVLGLTATVGGLWVYRHATAPEVATLTVISGSGALVRSPGDADWRLADNSATVREGDRISTALGTVVWLTMFDGSTVEVAEDTVAQISRMRSSRFLDRTALNVIELERGSVYISMTPSQPSTYSEFIVRAHGRSVVMPSDRGPSDGGSFLVEVTETPEPDRARVRIGVLRGVAWLDARGERHTFTDNQQVIVGPGDDIGTVTPIVRELIVNGAFEHGFEGWVPFVQRGPMMPEGSPTGAAVELVRDQPGGSESVAVEFLRGSGGTGSVSTGVRQRIGKTLRLHSSLLLQFDAKISEQHRPLSSRESNEFPLIVELNYIDIDGQEARWTYAYFILADEGTQVPYDRALKLDRDTWQRIVLDLRLLSPLPRQVTSIVVYASGESYQTRIANVSLSSGELIETAE